MIPHQIDAKALSKNNRKIITKPLTRPADETRIEYLATPKGKTPVKSTYFIYELLRIFSTISTWLCSSYRSTRKIHRHIKEIVRPSTDRSANTSGATLADKPQPKGDMNV